MDTQPNPQHTPPQGNGSMVDNAGPIFIPPNQPIKPSKPSHKKRNIIIVVAAAIVILLAIIIGLLLLARSKPNHTTTATQPTKTVDSAQDIIAKVNSALTDKSAKAYQPSQITQTTPVSQKAATSPSYKVTGTNYYVSTTDTYSLSVTQPGSPSDSSAVSPTFNKAVVKQITSVLTSSHYAKGEVLIYGTNYQSSAVICTVSPADASPVSIVCSNKDTYKKTSDSLKPFVTAYLNNPAVTSASDSVFSGLSIKPSSTDGYQTATVNIGSHTGVGGAVLLFYQTPTGTWEFFTATQNEVDCSSYTTQDEQYAYAGEKCSDGSGNESFVGASTSDPTPDQSQSNTSGQATPTSPTSNSTPGTASLPVAQ